MALLNLHQHPFRDLFMDAGSALRPDVDPSGESSYRPVVTVLARVYQLAQPPHRSTQSINDRLDVWARQTAVPQMRAILESHLAQFPALKSPRGVPRTSVRSSRRISFSMPSPRIRL